jgi:lipoprotein-releasing system permease protein
MWFSAVERMVAARYLRPHRREGFLSVIAVFSLLGIALGVATLIIVMSVFNGFREELLDRILGLDGHLNAYGVSQTLEDYDNIAATIAEVPGVVTVIPIVDGQVLASANGVATGALVRGVRPDDLLKREIITDSISDGFVDDFRRGGFLLVGSRLARQLGVVPGGSITLISPKGTVTAFGTVPRARAYPVVATFRVGMYEYDSGYMFMALDDAQRFFGKAQSVSALEVFVANPDRVSDVRREIAARLGDRVRVVDWQQTKSSFFTAVQVERNVMFLVLTLIILVAALNIISGMIMMVKDKGQAIAILRTVGATKGSVMRIFFLAGASIGVTGTLAGFGLGLAFSYNIETIRRLLEGLTGTELFAAEIYFLSRLPATVDPLQVSAIVLMALVISFLATLYPSWRASRLDPVEALRYE